MMEFSLPELCLIAIRPCFFAEYCGKLGIRQVGVVKYEQVNFR